MRRREGEEKEEEKDEEDEEEPELEWLNIHCTIKSNIDSKQHRSIEAVSEQYRFGL